MLIAKKTPHNSVWVKADSQKELGETFIRPQEYYESANPDIRGKSFTLGFVKQYYSIMYGSDCYHDKWRGFNFPSIVLQPFYEGAFDPLTKNEQELLDLFRYRNDVFYIIAAQTDECLRHELAHALFFHSASYRKEIVSYIKKNQKAFKPIVDYLVNLGYNRDVVNDEIQAYVTDNNAKFVLEHLDPKHISAINKIFKKYDT